MQTRDEFERVMKKLERDALERKLAEPAVSFALHAVSVHDDMLAALKLAQFAFGFGSSATPSQQQDAAEAITAAIAKAEGRS